ncbi:hypothetical protein [Frankia canadensis]|nr:hypothetical protein [Frankia canadensis]
MAHNPGRLSWQEIATTQAGVITMRDALATGLTRTEIRARLAAGGWHQPFRGVLVTDVSDARGPQHLWAAVQAIGPGAVLAGASAASLAGLVGYEREPVTVLVPTPRRATAPPGVLLRHSARLDLTEVDPLRLPRRTTPSRSVIDMAEWAPSRPLAQAIIVDAVHQGVVTLRGLQAALTRRGPITRRTLVADCLDRLGADAPHLTGLAFHHLARAHGLPTGSVAVEGPADEPMSRLRVRYESWRVQVEVAAGVARPGLQRTSGGALLVRLPPSALRQQPTEAAGLVAAALRQQGWPHPLREISATLAS